MTTVSRVMKLDRFVVHVRWRRLSRWGYICLRGSGQAVTQDEMMEAFERDETVVKQWMKQSIV